MTNIINVNLDNIIYNFGYFFEKYSDKKIYPVIKGNAYGFGSDVIVRILHEEFNCDNFFVFTLDEAMFLKKQFENFNFYPLGGVKFGYECIFIKNNIIPIINSIEQLERFLKCANFNVNLEIVLQFNSGMNRNGIEIQDIPNVLNIIKSYSLKIKFIMSHLACADDVNSLMLIQQLNNFEIISNYFPDIEKSISATDGMMNLNNKNLYDILRLGGGMYGFNYSNELKNVFSLTSKIRKKNNIYYIQIGRNNGIFKDFERQGFVLVHNKRIKISKVLNNKIVLNTNKNYKDKFCLLCGKYNNQFIDINLFSKNMNLIPYEAQVRLMENLKDKNFKINYFYKERKVDFMYQQIPVVYENKNIINYNQITSSIIEIRKIEEDGWIGYGAIYKVKKGDIIATFDVGYINGLSRKIKQKYVYVEDNDKKFCKCKIIGNISMDQTTILLNDNNFSVGNKVMIAKNKKIMKKYKDIFFMRNNRNLIFSDYKYSF